MAGSADRIRSKLRWDRTGLSVAAVLGALIFVTVGRVASSWRYFDRFMWDDGWYLQVARRVAGGEILYREVAWDYGPLPVHALSLLIRLAPSVVWFHLLDILLVVAAVMALYLAGRNVVSRRAALAVTAWVALLGGPVGLISHHLDAYTSPVAWGTSTSLAAVAAACVWVRHRSLSAWAATVLFCVFALLSKPEYGLAGLAVLATAAWFGRDRKGVVLSTFAGLVALLAAILLRTDPETRAAVWRGYTGYDLVAVGSVPILDLPRLFGSLLAAAGVGFVLWWLTRLRSFVVVIGILAALLLASLLAEGGGFLHAIGIVCRAAWLGLVPALLWIAWAMRRTGLPAVFWILCIYSVTVSLRMFLLGTASPAAAGPTALVFCLLVRHGILRPPTPAGWIALSFFLLFSSVESELGSLRRPAPLQEVSTALGTVRLPDREARDVRFLQGALDEAPTGGLFVAGGGPGWYLVGDRANPTRFDAIWYGLGTTEPEAGRILDDLHADPPAAVLVERDFTLPENLSLQKIWAAAGEPDSSRATTDDGRWVLYFVKSH